MENCVLRTFPLLVKYHCFNTSFFEATQGCILDLLIGFFWLRKTDHRQAASGFLNPTSGTVFIDEQDLSKINLRSFRQHLGVVLQDDFLYEGTIKEDILFPRPDAADEEVEAAAKGAYVTEFTDRFDDEAKHPYWGTRLINCREAAPTHLHRKTLLAAPQLVILDEAHL